MKPHLNMEPTDQFIEVWKNFLKNNSDPQSSTIKDGIFSSVRTKNNKLAAILIDHVEADNLVDIHQNNLLHIAIQYQNYPMIGKLCEKEVSLYQKNLQQVTPLQMVLAQAPNHYDSETEVVNPALDAVLKQKVLWGLKSSYTYPVLMMSNHTKYGVEIFQKMTVKKRKELIQAKEPQDNIVIQSSDNPKLFEEVISFAKEQNIDLNAVVFDRTSDNILIALCKRRSDEVAASYSINYLVNNVDINLELKNNNGETALFVCLINGNLPTAQVLMDKNANLFSSNFENKNPEEVVSYITRKNPDLHDMVVNFIKKNKERIELQTMLHNKLAPDTEKQVVPEKPVAGKTPKAKKVLL